MTENRARIDMRAYHGRVLSTRHRGQQVARHEDIMNKSKSDLDFEIIFNDNLIAITSSFFLGMFGDAVRVIGDEDMFLDKFKFIAPQSIQDDIRDGIRRALREKHKTII